MTMFNGTNYVHQAAKMAPILEQKQGYGIITAYSDRPQEPAANATATEMAPFNDSMDHHGVARWTILLVMDPRIHAEFMVVDNAKTL